MRGELLVNVLENMERGVVRYRLISDHPYRERVTDNSARTNTTIPGFALPFLVPGVGLDALMSRAMASECGLSRALGWLRAGRLAVELAGGRVVPGLDVASAALANLW